MRERLRLADLNILYVCTEEGGGPLVRRVLADAEMFRHMGGNALVACRPGSVLDKRAERLDLARFALEGPSRWARFGRLHQHARQLVRKERVDLVHCYNYMPLLPLGLALKRDTRVPLVYTCNERLAPLYSPFWHDYFVTRVDHVVSFSPALSEEAAETLPLTSRKFSVLGAGVELPRLPRHPRETRSGWRVCTFVPSDEGDAERVSPLLRALPALAQEAGPLVLELLTDVSWYEHPLYGALKHMVLERGLEHQVAFGVTPWGQGGGLAGQQLFIALGGPHPFDDYELQALLQQIPVLLPRTAARSQLLQGSAYGLTYHTGDVHEMKSKALQMLKELDQYKTNLEKGHGRLLEIHHFDEYARGLLGLYERLVLQRLRFSLKRPSPFTAKT